MDFDDLPDTAPADSSDWNTVPDDSWNDLPDDAAGQGWAELPDVPAVQNDDDWGDFALPVDPDVNANQVKKRGVGFFIRTMRAPGLCSFF